MADDADDDEHAATSGARTFLSAEEREATGGQECPRSSAARDFLAACEQFRLLQCKMIR
jgi:hypothetical protein